MGIIIMGGAYRGRKLETDTRAQVIRPTSGKVREALFSSLGETVEGSAFVDLYAGSGSVGLEALSRGAREAYLVENHAQSWLLLKANCKSVLGDGPDAAKALPVRAATEAFCRRMRDEGRTFDFVFADPPFGDDFSRLKDGVTGLLAPGGTGIIQFPSRNPPAWLGQAAKLKKYGESSLAFFT
ncbi:MAG TPA: RsmD family RNA methyltransferase [Fibrobacteria bacterium]|nr:RsmD family RNA methyltransferase [Fibrobacteria bacterium]